MNKLKVTTCAISLLLTLVFAGRNVAAEDFIGTPDKLGRESGLAVALEKSIAKNYGLRFNTDYRSLDGELYFRLYEGSLIRYFKDDWSAMLTHRWYYVKGENRSDWKLGNMSHVRIGKKIKTDRVDYAFRVAHEYFFGNIQGHQHRTRFRASLAPHRAFYRLKPFIANEIFYRHERARASRNWLSTGIEYYPSKTLKYYLYHRYETFETQEDKRSWNSSHGIFGGAYWRF